MSEENDENINYNELQQKYEDCRRNLKINKNNGKELAKIIGTLDHTRHDCYCSVLANRLSVKPKEETFLESIQNTAVWDTIDSYTKDLIANHEDANKTPDLFLYSNRSVGVSLHWYEVTITKMNRKVEARNLKVEKYEKFRKFLNKEVFNKRYPEGYLSGSATLTVIVIDDELRNWDDSLSRYSSFDERVDIIYKNLAMQCNNLKDLVMMDVEDLSKTEKEKFIEQRRRLNIDIETDPFKGFEINEEYFNDYIDGLSFSTKSFTYTENPTDDNNEMIENEEVLVSKLKDHIMKNWRNVKQPFSKPDFDRTQLTFYGMQDEVSAGQYDFLNPSEFAPTFHFTYVPRGELDAVDFESAFFWMCDVMEDRYNPSDNNSNSTFIRLTSNIFKRSNMKNAKDSEIFFLKGAYEGNWHEDKKSLDRVLEPKTFKYKVADKDSRKGLNDIGIKSKLKMQKKREQDKLENPDDYRKMKVIDIEDYSNKRYIENEISRKICWLCSKSNMAATASKGKNNEEEFRKLDVFYNKIMRELTKTKAEELSMHIKRVAEQVIFKSNSTGKGFHLIYTGNRRSWIVLLPSGDLSNKDGDIRFFNINVMNRYDDMSYESHMFNSEMVKEVRQTDNFTITTSRWMSLNRERWEHIVSVDPIPFIAYIASLGNLNLNNIENDIGDLVFAYMYSAFGCQAKISGLMDHFRYIIPAALAERSALDDYIREKLKLHFKSSGQVWLYSVLKGLCLSYLSEGKDMTMKARINITDDLIEENSAGVFGTLSSAFCSWKWNSREHAMAEVYIAFHLTGKAYHNKFMRDVDFVNTVMGNEISFLNNIKPLVEENDHIRGVSIDKANIIHNLDRGGLFCKEALKLSASLASNNIDVDKEKFFYLVESMGLNSNILTEKKLTSTRSSLREKDTGSIYKYPESQTILQTAIDVLSEEFHDEKKAFETRYIDRINTIFADCYNEIKKDPKYLYNTDRPRVYSYEESENVSVNSYKPEIDDAESGLKSVLGFKESKDPILRLNERLKTIDSSVEKSIITKRLYQFLNEKFFQKDENIEKIDIDKLCPSLDFIFKALNRDGQIALWNAFTRALKSEGVDYYKHCKEWEENSEDSDKIHDKVRRFLRPKITDNGVKESIINRSSPLYYAFKFIDMEPEFKIVPKGQRTEKDREIFVQNKTRFCYYITEHIYESICKMNSNEAITVPGDQKMILLEKMFVRAMKWKRAAVNGEVRKIRFITGDLTKFSNHDTDQRLAAFSNYMSPNISKKLHTILYGFSRIASRKYVYSPASLCKRVMNPNDKMMKYFRQTEGNGSKFPKFRCHNCNWLQGMRNFQSSCAHVGVGKSIKEVLKSISADLYYDFLAHSDDFAAVFGYVEYKDEDVIAGEKWISHSDINSYEQEDFLIACIKMIYNLNNLRISEKKSSISKHCVEFVSYINIGGSVYLGHEKQLFSMFSEKTGKGPKSDMLSLISQASGSIMKGSPSFVVDSILDRALNRLRDDYSMNKGMRFDPCEWFKIDRKLLPLMFLPSLDRTIIEFSLSKPELHDIALLQRFQIKIKNNTITDEEMRAAKLFCSLSKDDLGKPNLTDIENIHIWDNSVLGDIRFKGRNNRSIREKLEVSKWVDEDLLRLMVYIDETSSIQKPKDILSSLVNSHLKLYSNDVIDGLSSRNKLQLMRMKADFKNREYCAISSMSDYTTLANVLDLIKVYADNMTKEEVEDKIDKLNKEAFVINTPDKLKIYTCLKSKYQVSSSEKSRTRSLALMPTAERFAPFFNKTSNLLIYKLHPERAKLNGIELQENRVYEDDCESLRQMCSKFSEHLDELLPQERMLIYSNIMKFAPDFLKRPMFVTNPLRRITNMEGFIKHLLINNTHRIYRCLVTEDVLPYELMEKDGYRAALREMDYLFSQLAMMSSLEIANEDIKLKLLFKWDENKKLNIVDSLKKMNSDYSGLYPKLNSKTKRMRAFLAYKYMRDLGPMNESYADDWFMTYEPEEKKYKRSDAFKEIRIFISKGRRRIAFDFDRDSNMQIMTNNFSHQVVLEHTKWFYRRTDYTGSYKLDKYVYKGSIAKDCYYLIGNSGDFEIVTGADTERTSRPIIAIVSPRLDGKENYTLPKLTENKLSYRYLDRIPASISYVIKDIDTRRFEVKSVDDADIDIDLRELFKSGLIDKYMKREISYIHNPHEYYKVNLTKIKNLYPYIYEIIEILRTWYGQLKKVNIQPPSELLKIDPFETNEMNIGIEIVDDDSYDPFDSIKSDSDPGEPAEEYPESRSSTPNSFETKESVSGIANDDDEVEIKEYTTNKSNINRVEFYKFKYIDNWFINCCYGSRRCCMNPMEIAILLFNELSKYYDVIYTEVDFEEISESMPDSKSYLKQLMLTYWSCKHLLSNIDMKRLYPGYNESDEPEVKKIKLAEFRRKEMHRVNLVYEKHKDYGVTIEILDMIKNLTPALTMSDDIAL